MTSCAAESGAYYRTSPDVDVSDMEMELIVGIGDDHGPVLSSTASGSAVAQTSVYDKVASQADAEAERIIRNNLAPAR